jgi:hypothetical protein
MTRDSALIQIDKGRKVSHELFSPTEYIHKVEGKIRNEVGSLFGQYFNEKDYFSEGWTLYVEPQPSIN